MARTQAQDYDQRREAIVEKAARLFASEGFRGASVADLAAACETSKSLIYHYYPSKEDVLYEVMASHIDQLVQDVNEAQEAPGDAKERLIRLIRSFMAHYMGAANRQKVMLNELGNLPPDRRATIVGKQRQVIAAVQKLLTEIHPELARDAARARVQTMLMFGMINWTHTWYDPKGPISPEQIADMALQRILAPLV